MEFYMVNGYGSQPYTPNIQNEQMDPTIDNEEMDPASKKRRIEEDSSKTDKAEEVAKNAFESLDETYKEHLLQKYNKSFPDLKEQINPKIQLECDTLQEALDTFVICDKMNLDKTIVINKIFSFLTIMNFESISQRIGEDEICCKKLCEFVLNDPYLTRISYGQGNLFFGFKKEYLSKEVNFALEFLDDNGGNVTEYELEFDMESIAVDRLNLEAVGKLCPNIEKLKIIFIESENGDLDKAAEDQHTSFLLLLSNFKCLESLTLKGISLDLEQCKVCAPKGINIQLEDLDD